MLHTLPQTNATAATRAVAMAGYGRVSLEARIETASPHELVMMLYKRLVTLLREARGAVRDGNRVQRLRATEHAIAIVEGLDATLDLQRGGTVATALRDVYTLLRDRILAGGENELDEALQSAEAIATAWQQIRPAKAA